VEVLNVGSGTIVSYHVSPFEQVTFLRNTSVGTGAVPLSAVSSDGRDLYVLIRNLDELAEFSVGLVSCGRPRACG
jgi:hypothetical protein